MGVDHQRVRFFPDQQFLEVGHGGIYTDVAAALTSFNARCKPTIAPPSSKLTLYCQIIAAVS